MDPLTIIGLLAQFGPSLLKAIGVGADVQKVANTAAAVATAVTGKADLVEAADTLRADPTLQLEFQRQIAAQEFATEKLYVEDLANARARDIALAATPVGNVRANWLAAVAITIIGAILWAVLVFPEIPEFAKGVLTTILGVFLQQLTQIYAFEFGTTRRSQSKTDAINTMKV